MNQFEGAGNHEAAVPVEHAGLIHPHVTPAEEDLPPFDCNEPITFKFSSSEVTVRFPTDAEFLSYLDSSYNLVKPGRRSEVVRRVGGVEADHRLCNLIRLDSGNTISGRQAEFIARRLTDAKLVHADRTPTGYLTSFCFFKDFCVHHALRMPLIDQQRELLNCFRMVPARKGFQRAHVRYGLLVTLYDALVIAASGYLHHTPSVHKIRVVSAIAADLRKRSTQ